MTDRFLSIMEVTAKSLDMEKEDFVETKVRDIPLARIAKPEEIAQSCLFFLTSLSSYITGQTIMVDGGQTKGFY